MNVFQETERREAGSMVMGQPGRLPAGKAPGFVASAGKNARKAAMAPECYGCRRFFACVQADRVNCTSFIVAAEV